ncbi:MAG: hypothetical protein LKE48_02375 [Solobacterium sp.]|jgi:hypothetical protein|nr:hypothetical protein [Solobacterium sp.]
MRKKLHLAMALLLLQTGIVPVYGEEEKQMIHLSVHAEADPSIPCAEAEYEVFQDEQALLPATDEKGEALILKTDAKGEAQMELPSACFLKMKTAGKGYYMDPQVIAVKKELSLAQWPIRFAYKAGERSAAMQLKTEDGTLLPSSQAEAGQHYTVYEASPDSYHAAVPLSLDIPLYHETEKDPIILEAAEQEYGCADISFLDGETETVGIGYQIYQDAECTVKAVEVCGRETEAVSEIKKKMVSLAPGNYFLKILSMPSAYCLSSDALPFAVKAGADTAVQAALRKMAVHVHVLDISSGKEIPADIICREEEQVQKEENWQREKTYQIQAVPKDPGYFQLQMQTAAIPADADEPLDIVFKAVPFAIHVQGSDSETGTDVAMKYEIRNSAGALLSEARAGETVIFHEISCLPGYEAASDQQLVIPASSEVPQTYEISFPHVPYTQVNIRGTIGSLTALYTDASCTSIALDRHGMPAQAVLMENEAVLEMPNGIYYVKQNAAPAGYFLDPVHHTVRCQRTVSLDTELVFTNQKAGFSITSTVHGSGTPEIIYDIKENGQVIASLSSASGGWISEGINAGHTYEVSVQQIQGQYLYQDEQSAVLEQGDALPSLEFTFDPYIDLILHSDGKSAVKGALYLDAEQNEKALDIFGNPCEMQLSSQGASVKLAPGTYWFISEAVPHCYRTKKEIIIAEGSLQQNVQIDPASVKASIEIDNIGEGSHTMELRDEDGNLIKTWKADEENKAVAAEKLEAGKNYSVKDKDSGEETDFAMPEEEPAEKPVIKVETKEKKEDQIEQKEAPQVLWLFGGAAALIAAAGGGLLMHHRNEKGFKE